MDSGCAAILGALVGGALTIVGNVILFHMQTRRTNRLDEKRRQRLTKMLSGKHPWRTMASLASAIGADEDTTAMLLIEIDARTSETGNGVWGLVSPTRSQMTAFQIRTLPRVGPRPAVRIRPISRQV